MMKKVTQQLTLLVAFLLLATISFAQVTTSSMQGNVQDSKGEALVGATVVALHTSTGTRYTASTNSDGRFVLPNLRVGGPYTVTTSYIGFSADEMQDVFLTLAQKLNLKIVMKEGSTALNEVVVSGARDAILNGQRTGASTTINNEQLSVLPTISRSASDIYRLTPSSGEGNSFMGRNGQFNNFSLNGTIFNNPFGLDAATPGGQTDAQPVSLDAIDQIQVSLAPYDVSQAGFTGAAINSVTKSGTNEFKGTAYGFFRNNNMVGQKVKGTENKVPTLNQGQYGFSFGGPLVKDKLFFFVNAEIERRGDLGTAGWVANRGQTGANVSRVAASDFDKVAAALKTFGYDPGAYEGFTLQTNNNKAIARLDYNINDKHKFYVVYNWLDAYKEKPAHPSAIGRRGPDFTTMQFQNAGYRINNVIHSGIAELQSTFSSKISNKLQFGMTGFRDARDPNSTPFPTVNINKDGVRYIVAGHEPFSINNTLKQDVLQFNDNLNIYLNKHTLTVGGSFEKFQFDNSFNLGAYAGVFGPGYASVDAFLTATQDGTFKKDVDAAKATFETKNKAGVGVKDGWALAEFNVGQASLYVQDEFQVTNNATVTVGVRMDKPLYFDTQDKIRENISADRNCCYDPTIKYFNPAGQVTTLDHTQLPSSKPLFSPRLGFNWDVRGDRSLQLRGGSGLFTGRFPFVWVGNQVANPNFFFYCTTDPNFKFPQVWRSNIGYDQKFGAGWVLSADVIYTKDVNAVMIRNYGAGTPSAKLQGADTRPIYANTDRAQVFGAPTNAYVFSNTNVGSSFNTTVQLQRNWDKTFYTSLAYNFGNAKDASSISAEISSDAFDRNPAYGNINQAVLANSLYGNLHRVVGNVWKKFNYADGKLGTTVSVFFQYVKGGRYSYTYSGDINNDGSPTNDLIFIPTDAQIDQMAFSGTQTEQTAQRTALKAYIAQDAYLGDNRGQVSGKYVTLSPWFNNWDVRILQDLNLKVAGKTNTLQLSFDILNAGNLISSNWGVRQTPANTQPIGVSVDAAGKPTYSFDTNLKSTFLADPSFLSRWQMQVGLRYRF
jgi:Carboxypeptidase regulatory-like domain